MSASISAQTAQPVALAEELRALLRAQQIAFQTDMSPSHAVRLERLKRLSLLIESHAAEFAAAIAGDFGTRSLIEIRITENAGLTERNSSCHSKSCALDEGAPRLDGARLPAGKIHDPAPAARRGRNHQSLELPAAARAGAADRRGATAIEIEPLDSILAAAADSCRPRCCSM